MARDRIAKLNNTTGSADLTWDPKANGFVNSIAISGSDIYVGGGYLSIGGETRNRIAKLNNTTGAVDLTWNPDANGTVRSIAISGSDIYVGGQFTSIGGETRNRIAKLNNTTGAADLNWNPDPNGAVHSIGISGSDIYVGGGYVSIGGVARNRIAKLNNTTGSADLTWNPNANGNVLSIGISGSDVYVGGLFTSIGGQSRNRIAKLNNTTGSVDLDWNPDANDRVNAIALSGSDIYVGGHFTSIGGETRNRMAKLNNTTGSVDLDWDPNSNGGVNTIGISGSDIYVGGFFTSIGGETRNRIAKLNNTTGAADLNWNPNANNVVFSIAISGSDIYIGGIFNTIGGSPQQGLALFRGESVYTTPPAFISPTPECGATINVDVGSPVSFTIAAEGGDANDAVTLSVTGLPSGSSMEPSLPASGNPVSSMFNWTPTSSDIGSHQIIYTAKNILDEEVSCTLTVEVADAPSPPSGHCPHGQGYWKNHSSNWPVNALPMMLGTVTVNTYNQSELLSLFNAAPRGDASIILAHQLIAAKLNVANGSPLPSEVQDAIEDADAAIGSETIPMDVKANHPLRSLMISLAGMLEDYNNNLLTPNCEQMGKMGNSELEPVTEYALFSNYPNPFNPSTKISWQAPVDGHQTLKVFDVLGNEVAILVDEFRPAGRYEATFDANNLASGIYIYKLQAGDFVQTKKMIFLK